jgi:uncharacterized protein
MTEEKVNISVDEQVELEGRFLPGQSGGALILHPHPLYGGDMYNNVVEAMVEACGQAGWASLRVNFRGVGRSSGSHAGGVGEQDDTAAAWDWLAGRAPGPKVVMGYSFGALVGAMAAQRLAGLGGAVWVSPPYLIAPLPDWPADGPPVLAFSGDRDQFGDPAALKAYMQNLGALGSFYLFPGGDHFWFGNESALIAKMVPFLQKLG